MSVYPQASEQPQNSTLAIVSLVAGIATWLILPFLGAIIAIIAGHKAKSDIKKSAGQLTGGGMATAGLILGYLQMPFICGICIIVLLTLTGSGIEGVFESITSSLMAP
jgi:uncharacterized membrane protein